MLDRGDVFAGYRIEGTLGRGGMGAVYLARRSGMPRPVALKLLNSDVSADPEIRARFEDEAEVVAHLHHPGIVAVYDSGIDDARLWMAMQYVDGRDATVVSPHSLPPDRVIALVGTTADALDYAHNAGVLHRDVKPANILLARPTRARREAALLTDFGIARLREEPGQPTHTGTILATLAYAAPEQLRGLPLDHRSDQYSLACSLFRMLTGTLPHAATNPAAMIKGHLHDPPQPVATLRPELPNTLDKVMIRALAKDPADRYPTCTEFIDAVRQAFTGPTTHVFASRTTRPDHRPRTPDPAASSPARGESPSQHSRLGKLPLSPQNRGSAKEPGPAQDPQFDDESPTTRIPALAAYLTRPAKSPPEPQQTTKSSHPDEPPPVDEIRSAKAPVSVADPRFGDESPTTRIPIVANQPVFAVIPMPIEQHLAMGQQAEDSPIGEVLTAEPTSDAETSVRATFLTDDTTLRPTAEQQTTAEPSQPAELLFEEDSSAENSVPVVDSHMGDESPTTRIPIAVEQSASTPVSDEEQLTAAEPCLPGDGQQLQNSHIGDDLPSAEHPFDADDSGPPASVTPTPTEQQEALRHPAEDSPLLAESLSAGPTPAGPTPAEMSAAGPTPAEMSPAGPTPAEMSPAGPTPAEMSPAGPTPAEMSPAYKVPPAAYLTCPAESFASEDQEPDSLGLLDRQGRSLDASRPVDGSQSPTAESPLTADDLASVDELESQGAPEGQSEVPNPAAQLDSSLPGVTPLEPKLSLLEERKPVGVRATWMEIAPNVFLSEEIPHAEAPRPSSHRRPVTADKARLGYILMALAALLLVLIVIFG
ncbi:serine/threonine-protein kinase [Nocardia sp. XZ_19_385]|uniref:serine/threonine-protein kinase n=1 Tax=Nocardia sp. XZ_19_385 TaxID=2769488 RepID=UPI00188FB11D|nr:serine/threonine-protein kinase [Nocardia sp. XZ_19_385]